MVLASLAKRDGPNHERGGTVSEEARTGKRFPLELPIKLHSDAASGDAKGTTGNLSAAGVYIRADASLEIGSPVEFEITLPPDVTGDRKMSPFNARGEWYALIPQVQAQMARVWPA